jgi:hypothetical protein
VTIEIRAEPNYDKSMRAAEPIHPYHPGGRAQRGNECLTFGFFMTRREDLFELVDDDNDPPRR